jgi:glyoxylase-like metal-dependent hydrolase (beta-lactamase superfamily II)
MKVDGQVEEIRPGWYRVEIPLPGSPLKYLNSYVICGNDRNLVIDTGLNRPECQNVMETALAQLGIDRGKTDFFITHLHADHFGLVGKLLSPTSKVLFNRPDSEIIEHFQGWEEMLTYADRSGFPREELAAALKAHPGYRFSSQWVPELSLLDEGDEIPVGRYCFRALATPGHTPGHICLYEPTEKIIIAGDHVLIDITPNIQCWSDRENPLREYLASLDKVEAFEVALVLPGHRRLFADHRGRIRELREHHQRRLTQILSLLEGGALSAYDTARQMSWDINCESWDQFPLAQKWFATGEAIAHLRYLEDTGAIGRTQNEGIVYERVR